MNRQQAKELLPIIQAFAEGKTIQYYYGGADWVDVKPNEAVDFSDNPSKYRIKTEPKYRPFKNQNECWAEMLKHQPFGWLKDILTGNCNIIHIKENGIIIHNSESNIELSFNMSFNLNFIDGTPFGIKE